MLIALTAETASCILIVTQLSRYCRAVVAVPSSATLPSFLDD